MNVADGLDQRSTGDDIEFDQLCELCTVLFDGTVDWNQNSWVSRPHRYDIYALTRSAEQGCHLCSLLLGGIDAENVILLQQPVKHFHPAYEQLGVRIDGNKEDSEHRGTLTLLDLRNRMDRPVAKLDIWFVEDEHARGVRLDAALNCSDATIMQISRWLAECTTTHSTCADLQVMPAVQRALPTRLLNLESSLEDGCVKLELTGLLPVDTIYATLSHCWGGRCKNMLTEDSLTDFQKGIPLSSLPKTFQDAVSVIRRLGISYLWIDALCIIQDSKQNADWRQEASLMGAYYANSQLTLAATVSSNSEAGMVHRRSPLSVAPCRVSATWRCFQPGRVVISCPGLVRDVKIKPLFGRAWAFQERLLSKRLVHFYGDQVRWECSCLDASEVYPTGRASSGNIDQGALVKRDIEALWQAGEQSRSIWRQIRTEYSEMRLTNATDKLVAFSGIARMVHRVLGFEEEDYLAGLSRADILAELLWSVDEPRADFLTELFWGVKEAKPPLNCDEVYVAPSWSWASLNSRIDFTDEESKGCIWDTNMLDVQTCPIGDAFGAVESGVLKVECFLRRDVEFQASTDRLTTSSNNWSITARNDPPFTSSCSVYLDRPWSGATDSPMRMSCFFMLIRHWPSPSLVHKRGYNTAEGLLLRKVPETRGRFVRLGMVRFGRPRGMDLDPFADILREEHIDPSCYLERSSEGRCTIEIV